MLVRFFETAFTASDRIGARGSLHFRPIGDWTLTGDPDEHINSRPFTVNVPTSGRVDQELANTGVTRAWSVTYTGNPGWGPVYVQILGEAGALIDWPDLVRVDPATLEPVAAALPAWEALASSVDATHTATVAARDAAALARTGAETAQGHAETAQEFAEAAQAGAESAQSAAALSASDAATAKGLAESARDAAIIAKTGAETAEANAETAQGLAESARTTATTQAGIATTQAGIATTKAGEAATSAAAALVSETNAAATLAGAVTKATAQTITGAKTITCPTLVAAVPAATFGPDLTPAGGLGDAGWTLSGGATWTAPNLSIPSGGGASCTVAGIVSGRTYQVDVTRSASSGGDMTVALGAATVSVPSWSNSRVTVVATASGSLTLVLGGGTWVATVQSIVCREVTATPSPVSSGLQARAAGTNLGVGTDSQRSLTTGNSNVASGNYSQYSLTTGDYNVASGHSSQRSLTTGNYNVASGHTSQYTDGTTATIADLQYGIAIGFNAQNTASNTAVIGSAKTAERVTLEWLAWLVQRQVIEVGAPDAREQAAHAFAALDEIVRALDTITDTA